MVGLERQVGLAGQEGQGSGDWDAGLLGATAVLGALTVILTYPISIHPGSTSLGSDPDVHTFTWTLAWDVHAFTTRPWAIFEANIFFPYERTLAFSENLIGSAVLAAPFLWATGNPVLALNAVSLLSVFLCGLGAYVLGRRVGLGAGAALVCGVIFAFSPARFFRFAQTHLTAIQWVPFALAALIAYLDGAGRRALWLAAGLFALQALASGHGAVYLLIAAVLLIAFQLMTGTPIALLQRVRDLGLAGAALVVPVLLTLPPYLRVQREHGLRRSLENWAPAAVSFLASPTRLHAWLLSKLATTPVNATASAFMFPGYLPLVLGVIGLAPGRLPVKRRDIWFFAALTILAVLLASGPPLGLWPYVYWLPGFNFIRIPSRFIVLAVLGLAVLAGVGFERLIATRSRRTRLLAAIAAVAMLVAEFWTVPLQVQPYRVEIPSLDRWLDSQPKPFAIAEVPVGPFVRYHSTYMLHSMAHWQRTVHGHSSLLTPLHEQLYDELRSFPDEASVNHLAALGVTYVVVHRDGYAQDEWEDIARRLAGFEGRLTLVHEEAGGRVYRVVK
jgi:hypothetical protein